MRNRIFFAAAFCATAAFGTIPNAGAVLPLESNEAPTATAIQQIEEMIKRRDKADASRDSAASDIWQEKILASFSINSKEILSYCQNLGPDRAPRTALCQNIADLVAGRGFFERYLITLPSGSSSQPQ